MAALVGSIDMTAFDAESLAVVKADPTLGYNLRSSHEYLNIQFRLDTPPNDDMTAVVLKVTG